MMIMKKRKKSFSEISIEDLTEIVGSQLIEEDLNSLLLRTLEYTSKSAFSITIIKNHFDNTYSIYEEDSKQLLVLIEKLNVTGWICKPYFIFNKLAVKFLENFDKEISSGLYENVSNIIDDLFFLNELDDNDKLSDYLYRLSLIFIHQFNLDISKSKIAHFDNDVIIIDGQKTEYIYSEDLYCIQLQEVVYMINIRQSSNIIEVVKIYEDNRKEVHHLNLNQYILQEYDLINE